MNYTNLVLLSNMEVKLRKQNINWILEIPTCLAGLAGSFPPSTMNIYVCPLSTVISGMSKSLMYHAIPQAGCPIYLIIKIFNQRYKNI